MDIADLHSIMIVEDEPDIQAVARLALEKVGGFQVTVCGSGREALDRLGEVNPDLILLDVMMPDMDGLETYRRLRALPQTATIPIIFQTAKVQASEVSQYREMGALDVIFKPFDPMQLAANVRSIWEHHHG